MHTITAEFDIIPGKEAEAEAAILKLVAAVEATEIGAVAYIWHRGMKEPGHILVFEVYRDDEALQAHRSTPHLAEFQKCFAPGSALFDPSSVKISRYARFAAVQR